MRQRLTCQRETVTGQDTLHQPQTAWGEIGGTGNGTRWAKITQLPGGSEKLVGQQIMGLATHQINLRVDPALALTDKDRGIFNGRIFNFISVSDLEERGIEWEILAEEKK